MMCSIIHALSVLQKVRERHGHVSGASFHSLHLSSPAYEVHPPCVKQPPCRIQDRTKLFNRILEH